MPHGFGHLPRLAPHVVPRPRLSAQLDARPALTLLRAPVGFGKSTLVAQWVAAQASSLEIVIWVRIRPGAGDAESFWHTVIDLLAEAGIAPPTDRPPHPDDPVAVVERAVRSAERPVLLVVDAFDNITDGGVDSALLDLVHHLHHLRLMVALRGHRWFPSYQYLDLDAAVLTARDLGFTAAETADLLATAGVPGPAGLAQRLHDETAGWPEPVRAAALRLREQPTPRQGDLAETIRVVFADYLRDRLIAESTSPERVTLALQSAVPDDFTPAMIEVISDDPDAKVHVEALVRQGLLDCDEHDGTLRYRWHVAARRALRDELLGRAPDRAHRLHVALARWYADNGPIDRALRHALEARQWQVAIEVIERSWRDLLVGHDDVLHQTFAELPMEEIRHRPRVLAVRDPKARVPDADLHAAIRLPADEDELDALGLGPDAEDLLDTKYAALIAVRWRGATGIASQYGARLARIAEAARSARPEVVGGLAANIQLQIGITHLLAGDHEAAVTSLHSSHRHGWLSPRAYVRSDAAGKLALAHAVTGDTSAATAWLAEHRPIPDVPHLWMAPMVRSTGVAADLLLAVDRLDLARAAALDHELAQLTHTDEFWAYLLYARAQYALTAGAVHDALDRIERARQQHRNWLGPGAIARPLLAAAEADLHLALGRGNLARAALVAAGDEHPLLRVGWARLDLMTGDDEGALHRSADSGWERTAYARHRQEMLLIRAVAALRLGDDTVARTAVRHALGSVRATGTIRAFTTVARGALEELAALVPGVSDLLDDAAFVAVPEPFAHTVGLVELTAREQQVLEDLADGLTLPQIAARRVVSYNTVRSQKRLLYRKLDTSSRAEALARARRWGLLRSP